MGLWRYDIGASTLAARMSLVYGGRAVGDIFFTFTQKEK